MQAQRVKSIRRIGQKSSLDFEVDSKFHNFYAEGIVVSNSHSYCYGKIGIYTTYLKWKYPREFFLSCLRIAQSKADFAEEFGEIQREIPHFGIALFPPDIIKSELDFSLTEGGIRFGIGNIKGISDKAISKLKQFIGTEKVNKFAIFEAAKEVKLNIGVLSALIQSGALTDCGNDRAKAVLESQVWGIFTPREKAFCLKNGHKYNFDLLEMMRDFLKWTDANAKLFNKESRLETIRRNSKNYFEIYFQNSKNQELANYWYEKTLLGFSHSTTLKNIFSHKNDGLRNSKEIQDFVGDGQGVEFLGEVLETKEGTSKAGNKYLKITLNDELGTVNCMMLGDKLARYIKSGGNIPKEGDLVFLEGQKAPDIIWANRIGIQNEKIFMKLADLKNFKENG